MMNDAELDDALSRPATPLVEMMRRLKGDILILGIAGKMGITLGRMAVRATAQANVSRRIIGVSRFSDAAARDKLTAAGIETIACDLMNPEAVQTLPHADNVICMIGRKFGTAGSEPLTWAINTVIPIAVARRYAAARIVMFSTGCVYPLVDAAGPGCREDTPPAPVGEYGQASLARERVCQYFSQTQNTPMLIYRLNYAIDLRYGVVHDIARWVLDDRPVPLHVPAFNAIWQRDANERALLCLAHCRVPAAILNVTGAETVAVRDIATGLGDRLGKRVTFVEPPGDRAYLSDATLSVERFGTPEMTMDAMLDLTATWLREGGGSLNNPTHFETTNGIY